MSAVTTTCVRPSKGNFSLHHNVLKVRAEFFMIAIMNRFERKNTLINKRFHYFLLPTILSTIAISLNEFVDSIIVSHLLGHEAMSMVNMGFPIMLAFAVIYTLFGVGGSIVYAEHAGKQEIEKAESESKDKYRISLNTVLRQPFSDDRILPGHGFRHRVWGTVILKSIENEFFINAVRDFCERGIYIRFFIEVPFQVIRKEYNIHFSGKISKNRVRIHFLKFR